MVSIKGALTLAAIAVGGILFFSAGGFSGVGSKLGGFVGSGLKDFSSSITSAFTGGLFGGAVNTGTGGESAATAGDTGTVGPPPRTGTDGFDPLGNLFGNFKGLQNILDSINNAISNQFLPQASAQSLTGIDRAFALGRLRPLGSTFSEGFRTSQGLKVFAASVAPSTRFPTGRIIAVTPESRLKLEQRGFTFG